MVQTLAISYRVQDEAALRRFLEQHQFIAPLLDGAHERIATYFPGSQPTLELSRDPETSTLDEQLVIQIDTMLSPADALVQLGRFDRDWWLDKMSQAQGKMIVNVECL